MSVRIQQLKLPVTHTEQELRDRIIRTLRIRPEELIGTRSSGDLWMPGKRSFGMSI